MFKMFSTAATQAVSHLCHSLIALSITSWSRRSHSSSTRCRSSSTAVIRWWLYTHSCTIPTTRRRRGSDPTGLFSGNVAYRIRTASRARPIATRTTFDAAGGVSLTQYSFNSTQRPVFTWMHSLYFCCSVELLLS